MTELTTLIVPVVLSGGSGTRLWPVSRSLHPKQLLPIAADHSMLQATVARLSGTGYAAPIVVGGEEHRFLIADQLAEHGCVPAAIILEPEGRNTAAAIALAALSALSHDPAAVLLVVPSDHVIADTAAFGRAVETGLAAAKAGHLVTFGIAPAGPETGYGYIEHGAPLDGLAGVSGVERFVEKPDSATAQRFVDGGRHAWNGGIFLFGARAYLDELAAYGPTVAHACAAAMAAATTDGVFIRPERAAFLGSPNISIDYAVMEHTAHAAVVPVEMGWSDVGSWGALWDIAPHDAAGNALDGDVVAIESSNCLVRVDNGPAVAIVGVEDLVVVSTRDSVLVIPRNRSQEVRAVVDELKSRNSTRHSLQPVVHRPWGTYETTDMGERFQTKRIVVKPGGQLSLQMHYHRSEHWIVVSGTALVTIDGIEKIVGENQSAYIPAGSQHRLENPGKVPLHLIEVQCGPYLGEDDIVRYEDKYARAG
ncbi:mannose-1-phosphate guanylyltransferase/mannose-6-phosphate isomerase [Glacieibacterium megasporae]|uniref:mannose-1-phosphate guanylyltransferase/mannose-6-phosphate isomerase n=1 Tax=Glacieibacterium megasporae TaxID=2835787 RepID=UPI0021029327|nr:mannose-1-phosphate guanylyltransferase/mannose-6-phosphate isomerase [Polymorphobacter megasporae]